MNAKTIITLARLFVGGAIMITSMVTGENGTYQTISLFLMAVPLEALHRDQKE